MSVYQTKQTITTLDLGGNGVGFKGMLHLANALRKNTVKQVYYFLISYLSLLVNTDT